VRIERYGETCNEIKFEKSSFIDRLPDRAFVISRGNERLTSIPVNWNLRNQTRRGSARLGSARCDAAHGNSATALKYRNKALNKGIREELNQDRGYWSETPGVFLRLGEDSSKRERGSGRQTGR